MSAESDLQVARFDRLVSRSIALLGILVLIVLLSSGHRPPPRVLIAFAALYALGKVVTGTIGFFRQWAVWPATFAEAGAILLAAYLAVSGSRDPLPLFGCVALLLGSAYWRSRVARLRAKDA